MIRHALHYGEMSRSKNRTAEFRDSRRERREKGDNYDRRINYNEGGEEWAYRAISALRRRFKASFLRPVPVL